MGLLPAYVEDEDNIEEELLEELPEPREYEIDMKTGQLTGRIVTGIDAIKIWIWLVLNTPRYKSTIFPWSYGHEFEDLVGTGYTQDVKESEAERMTRETLLESPYISNIKDFECNFVGDTMQLSFTAETTYGSLEVEKNV